MRYLALALLGCLLVATGPGALPAEPKGDVQRGEQVYKTLCWTCHGNYGRGDGPATQFLAHPPPDFTDPRVLGQQTDPQLLAALFGGQGAAGANHRPMIMGEVLQEEALQDAIAYLRTLSVPGKHVSVLAGKDIYNTFCWVCHGAKGDGQGPAAKNLVGVKPRDFTAKDFRIEGREQEVRRTIFEGAAKTFHGSPYMPEWKTALAHQQILDVIEYLKTFKQPTP